MVADDIVLERAIIHILDSTVGMPVLSDAELDMGSDLHDFFKAHIEKITTSDEVKHCVFYEDSVIGNTLKTGQGIDFILFSQQIASEFFQVMNANIEIPPADLAVLLFRCKQEEYFAVLKLNYKSSYTHLTGTTGDGNLNEIILQKALLPSESQRLTEAAVIHPATGNIQILERRYEVNGTKVNYMSKLVLKCQAPMSQKAKLDAVTKAVEQVNKKYYGDDAVDKKMETKSIIYQELEEEGRLNIQAVKEKIFQDNEEMKQEFEQKIEKYSITEEDEIRPQNKKTTKKFETQRLMTDTGIEITIPMEQYSSGDVVEFITNQDGTISLLLKNIGKLTSK